MVVSIPHAMGRWTMTDEPLYRGTIEHFMTFVEETASCWYWLGPRTEYGLYQMNRGDRRPIRAHRASHIFFIGPIPEGHHIDHLCHNRDTTCWDPTECAHRWCVNPEHLKAVTPAENARRVGARITHCRNGHEYGADNKYVDPNGWRRCRECAREADRARGPDRFVARKEARRIARLEAGS